MATLQILMTVTCTCKNWHTRCAMNDVRIDSSEIWKLMAEGFVFGIPRLGVRGAAIEDVMLGHLPIWALRLDRMGFAI